MVKLTIEQGYLSIELECETLNDAVEIIDLIKDKAVRKTKFVIVNEEDKMEEEEK